MPVLIIFLLLIISALAGTTLMTLFSSGLSRVTGEEYSEPILLQKYLARDFTSVTHTHRVAWIVHYGVGIFFMALYYTAIYSGYDPSLKGDIIFGLIFGGVGVIAWSLVKGSDASISELRVMSYYLQLIFAHIVFMLSASAVFFLLAGKFL